VSRSMMTALKLCVLESSPRKSFGMKFNVCLRQTW